MMPFLDCAVCAVKKIKNFLEIERMRVGDECQKM
jgi:hypothetical protein